MSTSWILALRKSVFLALGFASSLSMAGEAFFSKDGLTVTMALCDTRTGLVQVDLVKGEITEAPLPAELRGECIESVARGSDGEALFLAKGAVWVWTPETAAPIKRVCSTQPVVEATNLFVDTIPGTPFTDSLFITGREKEDSSAMGTFYGRRPGAKSFASIFCRRVSDATGGTFSAAGRLFFISSGDLWEGGIQMEEDLGMERMGTLIGARIAPLAISNTDEANGGSMRVSQVATAGDWIYLQLRGRHMAAIVRTPMPAKPLYAPSQEDLPTVRAQLEVMIQSLSKTEIIADDLDDVFGFCVTEVAEKPRVVYASRMDGEEKGPAVMLWEGEGQARAIAYFPE